MNERPSRLTLITPARLDPDGFAPLFEHTLGAVGVAAVILDIASDADSDWRRCAEALCPIAQKAGAAFLIRDHVTMVREVGADGAHVTSGGAGLRQAMSDLKPDYTIGAGDCTTRHAAMTLGELMPDYILLGRLDGDEDHSATPTLIEWWSDLFELPSVALAADEWHAAEAAIAAGADFLALRDLVWGEPDGAVAGLRRAQAMIEKHNEAIA